MPQLEHKSRTCLNKKRVPDDVGSCCCPLRLTDVSPFAMIDSEVYETFI